MIGSVFGIFAEPQGKNPAKGATPLRVSCFYFEVRMSFNIFDLPAGAGKTHLLVCHGHNMARRGQNVLFVQPSRQLIRKTVEDELEPLNPRYPVRQIHGDHAPQVIKALMDHFDNPGPNGQIVFITHSALLKAPFLANKKHWVVIVDEVLGVDVVEDLQIPDSHRLLTDKIVMKPMGATYGLLEPHPAKKGLSVVARNPRGDLFFGALSGLAERITSDYWDVYTLQSGYQRLLDNDKSRQALTTFSILRPEILLEFADAIIASACLTDSMLYRLWTAEGICMKPADPALSKRLRYTSHQNGPLITIEYALEDDWSKCLRDKMVDINGSSVRFRDDLIDTIKQKFAGIPFAWMANNDIEDSTFSAASGAVRLPNSPHGLNQFQYLHHVVVMSALNPPPAHFAFMESRGITGDELRTAHYRSAVYQAVMRISIRNPADQTPKTIVVMDHSTAEWLSDLFPGSKVQPLAGLKSAPTRGKPGRRRQHATSADRTHTFREQQKTKWLAELDAINGSSIFAGEYPDLVAEVRAQMGELAARRAAEQVPAPSGEGAVTPRANQSVNDSNRNVGLRADNGGENSPPSLPGMPCNENTYKEVNSFHEGAASFGSVFGSLYDVEPIHADFEDTASFIDFLRVMHKETYARKTDNYLLSPSHFNPDMPGAKTKRGLANIESVRGIWLDNDGGDLTHQEFARIFPHLRILVWNTYSSSPQNPRWRAFIPTSHAMSLQVHKVIILRMMKDLNKMGYWSKQDIEKKPRIKSRLTHGFDEKKYNAASIFFLPCQAEDPKNSFFVDYRHNKDGSERKELDLIQWVGDCALELQPPKPKPKPAAVPAQTGPVTSPAAPTAAKTSAALTAIQNGLIQQKQNSMLIRREAQIEAALQTWYATPRHEGHHGFRKLAYSLAYSGLTETELEAKLQEAACFANSPDERRREIKYLVHELVRNGKIAA